MKVVSGLALSLLISLCLLGSAQTAEEAEYRSNQGPVLGEGDPGYSPGSLWVVLTEKLEGLSDPSPSASVVRVFVRGEVLQAEVGRGGSDEVLLNFIDDEGRAWMPVRAPGLPAYGCYVRASTLTIAPARP